MMQNCRWVKAIFRFLLRLITLFIWKGKKPCRSRVIEVRKKEPIKLKKRRGRPKNAKKKVKKKQKLKNTKGKKKS